MESEAAPKSNVKSAEVLFSVPEEFGKGMFTALIDTGCSKSLVSKKLVNQTDAQTSNRKQRWVTKAGEFVTHGKAELKGLTLPQFTNNRKVLFSKTKHDRYNILRSLGWTSYIPPRSLSGME